MGNNTLSKRKIPRLFSRDDPHMLLIIIVLGMLALISIVLAIGLGPVKVAPGTVAKIIVAKIPFWENQIPQTWTRVEENIVWGLRFPRVLLGMIVGTSLSMTGVAMQALVRNHLADPFILGVSSGAAATATLGMLFGVFSFLGTYSLSISAFLGAAITIMLVYTISRVKGRINITQLLLSGVALSMIMDAITRIITLSAPNALGLHNVTFWLSGSLAGAKWGYLSLPFVVIIFGMVILMVNHRALNALLMGDETAVTLGFNVPRLQKMLVLVASLLAGTTIAVSGAIGFVGLMVPHIARLLVGADHKRVLPVCALLGGILVVWVDVAARMLIAPQELPLGILTAIFGGPFFIWLLKRNTGKA